MSERALVHEAAMKHLENEVRTHYAEVAEIIAEATTGQDPSAITQEAWDHLRPEEIVLENDEGICMSRFVSGREGEVAYGGTRAADYLSEKDFIVDGGRLGIGMEEKSKLAGLSARGGKTIINRSFRDLSYEEKERHIAHIQQGMQDAEQSSHLLHKPAPDVGTSAINQEGTHNLMDHYAWRHHENNPDDPYWRAVITGKHAHGRIDFREAATGYGTHEAAEYVRQRLGLQQADTIILGFGNVGGMHALCASKNENMRVQGISDWDGTLMMKNPRDERGIFIDEWMFQNIATNGNFANDPRFAYYGGSKLKALQARLLQEYGIQTSYVEDNEYVFKEKTDILVPAALSGTVHRGNMQYVARNCKAIIEAGNDALTTEATQYLQQRNVYHHPAGITNFGGVIISDQERSANIATAEKREYDTSTERMQEIVSSKILEVAHGVEKVMSRMKNRNIQISPRQAAVILTMSRMSLQSVSPLELEV